jgi:protein required for attachment to host cells
MNIWIVCPNLWGARIFVADNPDDSPRFMREFHPKGLQLRHEDFDGDGDMSELNLDPEREDEERVASTFSDQLGHWLETGAEHKAFTSLILCAEEHFLAILQSKLGPRTQKLLTGVVKEDLYEVNESDLTGYVQDFTRGAA